MSTSTKTNELTILKFKRHRTTYILFLNLKSKSRVTLKYLKEQLLDSIISSGGLLLNDNEESGAKIHEDDEDIDIEVPKSEFIDDDSSEPNKITHLTIDDVQIAVPKDKTDPYSGDWVEISDNQLLSNLDFKDNDIVAFRYQEEGYDVAEATYNE